MSNRILVCVDDDASILQMLQYQLELVLDGKACITEFYEDAGEAIRAIDSMIQNGLDVVAVLVDYQMPHINGSVLVRKLKASYPNLKCIMLSGQANEVQIDELLSEKLLDAFISKPWSTEDLSTTLTKYIQ
jgi:thioredoxin reductase (NADPH)